MTEGQDWQADAYARHAGFVPALGGEVLDLLAPQPGEHILDLGCGDGVLTAQIAARGARVLGVDNAPGMLAAARNRGIETRGADVQALGLPQTFDAVFSNAALHWVADHDAVIRGVCQTLRPGGRFVGEFGGHGNVAAIVTALAAALDSRGIDAAARMPWTFPTAQSWQARLERHGFRVVLCALVPRPTPLPTGMPGWLETFTGPFLVGFDTQTRAELIAEVTGRLALTLRDADGNWTADYVRLRFAAVLQADPTEPR